MYVMNGKEHACRQAFGCNGGFATGSFGITFFAGGRTALTAGGLGTTGGGGTAGHHALGTSNGGGGGGGGTLGWRSFGETLAVGGTNLDMANTSLFLLLGEILLVPELGQHVWDRRLGS